jgi:hypothetical protein
MTLHKLNSLHASIFHEESRQERGASGHSVIAVNENPFRVETFRDEAGRRLELGQQVGVGHVRNGDLLDSLK